MSCALTSQSSPSTSMNHISMLSHWEQKPSRLGLYKALTMWPRSQELPVDLWLLGMLPQSSLGLQSIVVLWLLGWFVPVYAQRENSHTSQEAPVCCLLPLQFIDTSAEIMVGQSPMPGVNLFYFLFLFFKYISLIFYREEGRGTES
uniref:Uncharacterized protein n=1 Tax=Pipistrellus kuhlii TaxID=59472 RepID=A0A7J7YM82_PIPKU|nr:hypothetical protein mPipKuh1_010069 [Pipistrellus kuhlii]